MLSFLGLALLLGFDQPPLFILALPLHLFLLFLQLGESPGILFLFPLLFEPSLTFLRFPFTALTLDLGQPFLLGFLLTFQLA